jgi:hypothetical protein
MQMKSFVVRKSKLFVKYIKDIGDKNTSSNNFSKYGGFQRYIMVPLS